MYDFYLSACISRERDTEQVSLLSSIAEQDEEIESRAQAGYSRAFRKVSKEHYDKEGKRQLRHFGNYLNTYKLKQVWENGTLEAKEGVAVQYCQWLASKAPDIRYQRNNFIYFNH